MGERMPRSWVSGAIASVFGDLSGITPNVPLHRLLERAGALPGTVEVAFGCVDGYTESLPLDNVLVTVT